MRQRVIAPRQAREKLREPERVARQLRDEREAVRIWALLRFPARRA
jgi:hypothetical protein